VAQRSVPVVKLRPVMRIYCLLALLLLAATSASAQNLELSAAQRQWVAAHKLVRVAPNPDLAPLDGIDSDGRQHGLTADYLKLIAARTGLEFRVVRMAARDQATRALNEHRIDIVPGVVANVDDQSVLYTSSYLRLPAAIYTRSGELGFATLAQLGGHVVAAVEPWPAIVSGKVASIKMHAAADTKTAMRLLLAHDADAYVGDTFTAADAIARLKLDKDIVLSGQTDVEAVFTLAVRSDWPQLRSILDAAINSLNAEDDKTLRERWLKSASLPTTALGGNAEAQALPPSHAKAIAAALQAAGKSPVPAETRKQAEDLLNAAQVDEQSADELAAQWRALSRIAATADAEAQKIEDRVSESDANAMLAWRASLPERATVADLEDLLSASRDNLLMARGRVSSLETEIARQASRPFQLRSELTAARSAFEQARTAPPASGDPHVIEAQDLRNLAATRVAAVRIALLQLENSSYEPRLRLLNAQLRERQRESTELTQRETVLENLVLDRSKARVAELRERVAHERDEALAQFRMLDEAATENMTVVDRLDDGMHTFTDLRLQKQQWEDWQKQTAQALKNTEERIHIGGVSEAVGLILLAEKSRLKPLPLLRRSLAKLQTELAQTRIGLIEVREHVDELGDLGEAVSQALTRLPEPPPERRNDLRTTMYRLLATRAEILPRLLLLQTRLAATQGDAEQALRDLVETTEKLGAILDSRLLWTPSHKPVDGAWLARIGNDAATFFNPRRWMRVLSNLATVVRDAPLPALGAASVLALLFVVRRRVPMQLERIAAPMRRIRSDGYRLTSQALFWTAFGALTFPALIWLVSYACRQAPPGAGRLTEEVGYALSFAIAPAFALGFLRVLTIDNGLAHAHFRWPRPRREALRNATVWLAAIVLPVQFVLTLLVSRGDASPIDTLGRLLLALALVGAGAVAWQVFAPGRAWTVRGTTLVEPVRLRQFTRLLLVANGVILAALVLRGYFVTGMTLSERDLASLGALLAIATAYGLAVRWLVLGERRLALQRMQTRKAADEQREDVQGEALPEAEPEEITLGSVSEQTRNILRALTAIAAIATMLGIWSDVLPAIKLLDTIPVWGKEVTLLGVMEAIAALALTWIATRNLPGLIEVGLLRHIHIDAATRYAVTSLTRYIIVFAGTIAGLSLLGLQWSSLQWLAAGFSVGLGFGLQEIFANFISGLMVLFERPIRVGDVITIGTVEGTVTRIRTRATTIVDWDNREVIVPNKSFITDRLVNWTLSDSVTRIVIKVGIAYRNDPRQAQQLLLDIARTHPLVLREPEPMCWMTGFGDSSQDFELRAFVAEIGQRNPVRTELQMRIAEVFHQHDIEIAFPQMDLWVRSASQTAEPSSGGIGTPRERNLDAD